MTVRRAVETPVHVGIVIFGLPDSGLTAGETPQVGSVLGVWAKSAILVVNLMIAAILLRVVVYVVSLHSVNAAQFGKTVVVLLRGAPNKQEPPIKNRYSIAPERKRPQFGTAKLPSSRVAFGVLSIGILPLNLPILAPDDNLTGLVILRGLLGIVNRPLLVGEGSRGPGRASALNLPVSVSSGRNVVNRSVTHGGLSLLDYNSRKPKRLSLQCFKTEHQSVTRRI